MGYGSRLDSAEALARAVQELGFLPFFRNEIPGFSGEERTPRELWFTDEPGPWDWKGPVIRAGGCVYGKFFRGRAVFVSLDWFPDLANLRRDGYDYDARVADGLAPWHDRRVYEVLCAQGGMLSRDLKNDCGYGKEGLKGFDQVITRLQMQTYVCVENFEYALDRHGAPYGWGVARYNTPEALYGGALVRSAYRRDPAESRRRLLAHLGGVLPAETAALERLLR
jgi:hypothetical protein